MKIEVRCAWCKAYLGSKECKCTNVGDSRITHSIFKDCREKLLEEMEEPMAQKHMEEPMAQKHNDNKQSKIERSL